MSHRVLVIDDSPVNRMLLAQLLRSVGAEVIEAGGGAAGLALASQDRPDLILLDACMPDMDGLTVLSQLKADSALQDIPVLVVSVVEEANLAADCFERGAEDYVCKPYNPGVLKARVRAILQRKQKLDQLRGRLLDQESLRSQLSQQRKLAQNSLFDSINGVFSRKAGSEWLRRLAAAATRYGTPLTCLQISLSPETASSAALEALEPKLRKASEILQKSVRQADLACRFGSTDFLVACPHTDLAGAEGLAVRLLHLLGGEVEACCGIATLRSDLGLLLQDVDDASRRARDKGAGFYHVFKAGGDAPTPSRGSLG